MKKSNSAPAVPSALMTTPRPKAESAVALRQQAPYPPVVPAPRPDPVSLLERELMTTGELTLDCVVTKTGITRGTNAATVEIEIPTLAAELQQSGGSVTLPMSQALARYWYPGMRCTMILIVSQEEDE